MSAGHSGFVPFTPETRRLRTKVELTGGYKAFIAISFIILVLGAAAAIATLVLVAIRFDQTQGLKHNLHNIQDLLNGDSSSSKSSSHDTCISIGDSGCHSNRDCCRQQGTKVNCNSGTCEVLITSHSGKNS